MAAQQRSIVWVDVGGSTTATVLLADPDGSAIQAALQNHTNADVLNWWEGPPNPNTSPAPGTGVYAPVGDQARLTFTTSAGGLVTLSLPAPASGIFLADGITVDSSAIADVIAAVLSDYRTPSGATATAYTAGVLFRKKVFAI